MAEQIHSSSFCTSIAIIKEVYNSKNSLENFEQDLERALEACIEVIVIEPNRLGDETSRWISIGNRLHKTAYFSGVGSLGCAILASDKPYLCNSFCLLSLLCTGVYTLAWHFDPCVYYQVERSVKSLLTRYPELKMFNLSDTTSTVILVRNTKKTRAIIHSGVTILAAVVCLWRLYDNAK